MEAGRIRHESCGTGGGAISLEVRAQCVNKPQNATDIKAWKWIINGNIWKSDATNVKSLTAVKSKFRRFENWDSRWVNERLPWKKVHTPPQKTDIQHTEKCLQGSLVIKITFSSKKSLAVPLIFTCYSRPKWAIVEALCDITNGTVTALR